MRILTISNVAWDDRNSFGNTMSNWFSEWKDIELCSIYTRGSLPNNNCCHHYFQVSIGDIARNLLTRYRIGRSFSRHEIDLVIKNDSAENHIIQTTIGWKRGLLRLVVEFVYASRIWFNRKTQNYILDYDPDVVFCFALADSFRYTLLKYIKRNTKAKIVMWIADDVWGQVQNRYSLIDYIYRKRYASLFEMTDKLYGASEMLCNEYSHIFGKCISPLYKGCTLELCKMTTNQPIQMVYAGNLLYGRDQTLAFLAKQLRRINQPSRRIQLSIYSSTTVSKDVLEQLNIEGTSRMYGVRPYEEIKRIMRESDVVLHVESFSEEQMKNVRLSFSTKIIDCLQSGSLMMVIGPQGIASVEYPRSIEGVVVVDQLTQLIPTISYLIENPQEIITRARSINNYAREHHGILAVRSRLKNDLHNLVF